ncbi:ethionine resistance protein [Coemansia erecta]|uniref:Ethionine resistance protein n=1 Tax=Coemansia erecta TaxID=147472 RepID=A0A9W7XXS5_9FUNG|nr:ethionine resistance protein [Coemansia erecta]
MEFCAAQDQPRETAPLLTSYPSETTLAESCQDIPFDDELSISRASIIKQEALWVFSSSIPLSLAFFCQTSFNFFSLLTAGRLGVNELAAASLSVMLSNVVVCMPGIGLASALESFCSAAYTASSDKTRVGFHAQRGLFAVTFQLIPSAILFYFIDNILLLLGQTPEVSDLCGRFLRIWILGSWPLLAFECLKRFVQAQGIMQAGTWVTAVVAPIHVLNSYLLVWSSFMGLGFIGAPVAMVISNWLLFFGIVGYILFSKARHAWGRFSFECLNGIGEYYRLAIPSAAMMALSWLAFETITIGAAAFGPVALAAQACIFSTMALTYTTPASVGSAAATRIGNALGQGKQRRARYTSYVSLVMGYVIGMVFSLVLFAYRESWGYIFTDDPEVVAMCAQLMPYFAATMTYDGMNGLVAGIMRALGRQGLGAAFAFPSFWLLAIPTAFYLGMGPPGLESVGLFLGLAVGVTVYSLAQQCYIIFYVDWRQEVKICLSRLARSSRPKLPVESPISAAASSASLDSYGSIV